VTAGARGYGDEAVGALFGGFVGETVVDYVVEDDASVGVDGVVEFFAGAKGGDDERNLPFDAKGEVLFEARIAFVDNLVDGEGRGGFIGVGTVPGGKGFGNGVQPFIEQGCGAGVEGRKCAHDSGSALGDYEGRV